MGKRKPEKSEEVISRKIRKLERKLLKSKEEKAKTRRRVIYSSDEDTSSNSQSDELPPTTRARAPPLLTVQAQVHDASNSSPSPRSRPSSPPPRAPSPSPSTRGPSPPLSPRGPSPPPSPRAPPPPPPPLTSNQAASAETLTEEIELDGDILQLLGDAPKSDTPLGPPIHKDVASRWQEILAKGLPKEIKDKLFEEYLVPSNCDFLIAPTLNPEAKAALSDPLVKRDSFLMQKQKQLGVALSALSSATTFILANETSKQKLLKPISDACRILCDNHFIETKSRRNLIISASNMQHKDTLVQSVRDKSWLFGENISEKLKAAQSIQKSGSTSQDGQQVGTKHRQRARSPAGAGAAARRLPPPELPALPAAAAQDDPQISSQREEHTPASQNTTISCREAFRQTLLRKSLPPQSVEIMLASLSDSTYRQYDGCIKAWIKYCDHHSYDYTNVSILEVINFLTEVYLKGARYGTINSYKSALSLLFGSMLEDDKIRRFMKGVSKLRPPNPKYNLTWDPNIALNYLAEQWPNGNLSLETLSKKTVTLLALVTAHRVQTLSLIKLPNIVRHATSISIKISDPIKTTKLNTSQPVLRLPYFDARPEICPARCLNSYLDKTKTLRNSHEHLFISYKKPFSKVTSQTLSRWIKETLGRSGIDTSIFSGHSTRHAATSAAGRLGVGIDLIRKTAGWTESSSVFAKFYNRDLVSDPVLFANSILSANNL